MKQGSELILMARRAFLCAAVALAGAAHAETSPVYVDGDGHAANGYDVVAYFSDEALEGDPAISVEHGGFTYLFASQANADAFAADPESYLPQFGGYCAYGVAVNKLIETDPDSYSVIDGKLYLNYNLPTKLVWLANVKGYLLDADNFWPHLIKGG